MVSSVVDAILHLHGWAALAVLFALPALESSAFLGFLFPGEVAVLLGGVLAFQHRVSLPAAIAAAVVGAIVGDTVGYQVGKRYGRRMLHGTIGRIVSTNTSTGPSTTWPSGAGRRCSWAVSPLRCGC